MTRKPYPSDLTDAEWETIQPLLPLPYAIGSPRTVDLREVLDAIFYWADNGIKWRALPQEFPPWQTVYGYFRSWARSGVWEQLNAALVLQVRTKAGREAQPSLAIIDSQSVEMTQKGDLSKVLMEANGSKGASVMSL
ncbi:Mobile element protein [uncultured Leptolyngbya sp.]|uniref:Mobile element protein n=1 Tax=uncultured Leptolyngbya sp. TaxID=332963 RepID=A0A6J4P1T6_9CYAN|nr:Mobile element protein [uncultured Leptolyngbya sp.]